MKTLLEVFVARLLPDRVRYLRTAIWLTSPQAPDAVVRDMVEGRHADSPVTAAHYLSHSTSWRFEPPDTVVLTYLVCLDDATIHNDHGWRELPAQALQLAHSHDPHQPHPSDLQEHHVLSHALRHLAFLSHGVGQDNAVRSALSPQALPLLARAVPALAGELI